MKKYLIIALSIFNPTFLIFTQNDSVRTFSTWNLTQANKKAPNIDAWEQREEPVIRHVKFLNSDLLAFQEVIDGQFESLQKALPNYGWTGEKRNAYVKGLSTPWLWFVSNFAQDERCPIFYNKEKFELTSSETFSINTQKYHWKSVPRIAVIACFKDTMTKKEFCVCNCHLDHKSQAARILQTNLIMKKIAQKYADKDIILAGDFNTSFDGDFEKVLTENKFVQAKFEAPYLEWYNRRDITHKKSSTGELIECDHIFVKPAEDFNILNYSIADIMSPKTSDHNSVSMTFKFKE